MSGWREKKVLIVERQQMNIEGMMTLEIPLFGTTVVIIASSKNHP